MAIPAAGTATGIAHPNIAFIKYWGNRDDLLRLPANGSISMNLDGLFTRTTVTFDTGLKEDSLFLNNRPTDPAAALRVSSFLDVVRGMAGINTRASVTSENNFPTGAGIASSASAFAALSLAAAQAAGLTLSEAQLSALARRGSGSACRSVPGGFTEWLPGSSDSDSYAVSIAPADHWDLCDCIAVLEESHKPVGSSQGHALASSSILQAARVADAARRLDICRRAILNRDFEALASVSELDSNLMHAVMMTSTPPLFYWTPVSLAVMKAILGWRSDNIPVFYTLDAGPNVHAICLSDYRDRVVELLVNIVGVRTVLTARPGGAARLVSA